MSKLIVTSIVTGVLCGIWTHISIPLGLIGWAGFAACTTYFASGKRGLDGFMTTIRQNLFGVLCGVLIILLGDKFGFPGSAGFFSGLLTTVMCLGGGVKIFAFVPGTFVGCYSTFAANGDYKLLIISLLAGAVLGVLCDLVGEFIYSKIGNGLEKAEN